MVVTRERIPRSPQRPKRGRTPKPKRIVKAERLDTRLSADRKAVIQRAANLSGVSLTNFVVESAYERAEETIRRHEVMTLTARDSVAFVEALLNPPAPNERLLAAARRYREFVGE